jgi:uncharacterized protein
MDKSKLKKIRSLVKKMADLDDWRYHINPVTNYAKSLAKKLGANVSLVEVIALLHDIGRIKYGDKNHHLTGAREAEKVLKKLKFDPEVIKKVKHGIAAHRSQHGPVPQTLEAKIMANADGMVHFDMLPLFFYWRSKKSNFDQSFDWVVDKYKKSWDKKVTLPAARRMVARKHQAIQFLLKEIQNLKEGK